MAIQIGSPEQPVPPMPSSVGKLEEEGLKLLRKPFPPNQISKLPKPYKKDSPKGNCKECGGYHGLPAVHLDYVGHAALTDRLLDADPAWTWEPLACGPEGLPQFDASGGLWIRLTVCGVTRLGYGNAEHKSYMDVGARDKECIGDALRNAAMRFGAALDLWHKGDLHADDKDDSLVPALEASIEQAKQAKHGVMGAVLDDVHLDTNVKAALIKLSEAVKREFASTTAVQAFELIKEQGLNDDERVWLWSLLPSNIRSALKTEGARRAS